MVEKPVVSDNEEQKKKGRRLSPLQALETYSAYHPEPINELLEWPYRRFIKAFEDWARRDAANKLDEKMNLVTAALHANTNWDDEKNDRGKYIESIEEFYELQKDMILKDPKETEAEEKQIEEMESNDPFLAAGKRNRAKLNPDIRFRIADNG